jgi:hypothetical protein
MKPSREDVERDLNISIPDDAEIQYGDYPPADPSFKPWAWCKDRYQVFIKTPVGQVVVLYVALTGFFPLPTPYEVVVAAYPYAVKAVEIAWNDLRSQQPIEEPAYLAVLPPAQSRPLGAEHMPWGSLTVGTSVVTVSGLSLGVGQKAPDKAT